MHEHLHVQCPLEKVQACTLALTKTHALTVFLDTSQRSSRQPACGRAGGDAGNPGLGFRYTLPPQPLCGAFEMAEDCMVSSCAGVLACLNS
jgi:hypothetical protein